MEQSTKDGEERVSDIRSLFAKYSVAFAELASNMRNDNGALLDYYTTPARIVGLDSDMVMLSPEAITGYGGVGAELELLRRRGLVGTTITDLSVNLINMRGAMVEVTWQRSFLTGESYSISQVYIVVHEPPGWRITTVIEQPQ
jgi:hypothetical protein